MCSSPRRSAARLHFLFTGTFMENLAVRPCGSGWRQGSWAAASSWDSRNTHVHSLKHQTSSSSQEPTAFLKYAEIRRCSLALQDDTIIPLTVLYKHTPSRMNPLWVHWGAHTKWTESECLHSFWDTKQTVCALSQQIKTVFSTCCSRGTFNSSGNISVYVCTSKGSCSYPHAETRTRTTCVSATGDSTLPTLMSSSTLAISFAETMRLTHPPILWSLEKLVKKCSSFGSWAQ